MASITILHTNDLHGSLDDVREATLASLRARADLYFDTGDAVKSGNLGLPLRPEPVWERFARLNLTAGVIGNRETHILERGFKAKIAGATSPILCANMRTKAGDHPLPSEMLISEAGLTIGVFAVSVPMVTEKMATQAASFYLWDQPIKVAAECVERLRSHVELLIGLTHIGHRQDILLAESVPGIDILLTGHSHTILEHPIKVVNTWLCQGGSHARYAGLYRWEDGEVTGGLKEL